MLRGAKGVDPQLKPLDSWWDSRYLPALSLRARKAHEHLAHKQFLGHPGHRTSRPGTRTKMLMFLGLCTPARKRLTPGHPVGRPPLTQAVIGQNCLCLCAFSFHESRDTSVAMHSARHRKLLSHAPPNNKKTMALQGLWKGWGIAFVQEVWKASP